MRSCLAALLVVVVAACGGAASQDPPERLKVEASALEIPADGATAATVTVTNSRAGGIVVSTSLGTLTTGEGQSGQSVTLPRDGAVTFRSSCDATLEDGCWGTALISATDSALASGIVRVSLACSGTACKEAGADPAGATAIDWTQGWGSGASGSGGSGGGGGGLCTGSLEAKCVTSTSGVQVHYALGGNKINASGTSVSLRGESSASLSVDYTPDGGSVERLTFTGDAALAVKTYTDDGNGEPPTLVTLLTCDGAASPIGGFRITKLERASGGGYLEEFTATFQEHCKDDTTRYICGCVHWVP
jgi:hypothetical protein